MSHDHTLKWAAQDKQDKHDKYMHLSPDLEVPLHLCVLPYFTEPNVPIMMLNTIIIILFFLLLFLPSQLNILQILWLAESTVQLFKQSLVFILILFEKKLSQERH